MRRTRFLAVLGCVVLLAGGGAVAWAAGETTGTASVCSSTPAHTISDNGSPIATLPGDSQCATTTYTIPTVTNTVTTTETVTTTVPVTTAPTTTSSGGTPIFSDEFNGAAGSKPDPAVWSADKRTPSSGTLFDGWNQISEDGNGNLVITAYKNTSGQWVSGLMYRTATYSGPRHVEVRAQVPAGYGTWAAPVWEIHKGAADLEDDVVEQLGREPQTYHTTLHNWAGNVQSGKSVATNSVLANGFHVYAADVYADHVDFIFDGSIVSTISASAIGLTNLTQYAVNPVIDLNMGGSWAGTPTIAGPVSMLVDYVRVTSLP